MIEKVVYPPQTSLPETARESLGETAGIVRSAISMAVEQYDQENTIPEELPWGEGCSFIYMNPTIDSRVKEKFKLSARIIGLDLQDAAGAALYSWLKKYGNSRPLKNC